MRLDQGFFFVSFHFPQSVLAAVTVTECTRCAVILVFMKICNCAVWFYLFKYK